MAKTKAPRKPADLEPMRHSLAHVLAMAVLDMFPEAKLGIGPATDDGFYYDFDLPRTLIPEDLPILEQKMRKIVKQDLGFESTEVQPKEAVDALKAAGQPYKVELAEEFAQGKEPITFYKTGDFTDLCRGGHVKSTKEIGAFTLTRIAGAYWRGDETRPQLQRIYGVAFATQQELDDYLKQQEAAKQRDHRKLGKELKLFIHSELVGGGLPLWTPRGTVIRDELNDYVQGLRATKGFSKVTIPHLTRKDLYEQSGHWQKFEQELFRLETREGHQFAIKPMNCPHHAQIYKAEQRSYRDLPVRYQETTMVYRDEQSGELSGLSRVRSITQDDAHVFCRDSQIEGEVLDLWEIIETFYGTLGLPVKLHFSTHDSNKVGAYAGTDGQWNHAESELRKVIEKKAGQKYEETPGEAAFYGPKLDFISTDALGREWQVATIQLDFFQPEGLGLTYVDEGGEEQRVVMIHCAVMGSLERFIAPLIEHFAGAFPLWLAPEQVRVLSISEKQAKYARSVTETLRKAGLRVEMDADAETIGKKIRTAEKMKVPYMLVVGDKEAKAGSVALRSYHRGNLGVTKTAAVTKDLAKEATDRVLPKTS